ncbi:other/SCY1 protein kinase [Thelephora terrestris]|uniref:Other/SCY1 protein kinase n=1 Tax=Thelephora terrestris TaxID=56493 RepID=A0A9P6HQL2_9AGAM|nr:other/SCY1 protein kinase [Thelephora terrestris]
MFAAASSFFARSNISQNYNVGGPTSIVGSRSGTPAQGSSSNPGALPTPANTPAFLVGPWKVQSASHKTTNKRVSVWTFDKKSSELEKMGPAGKERTLEVLKSEATSLSRLRHPCILEMVEPLEETRSELIFATEPLMSSLYLSIPNSNHRSPLVELDEVEIQKGILQLCKGLSFLHTSARLIHSNLSPESILITNAGDWKIGGLGLTIPLVRADGQPTRWEFPTFDGRVMPYIQRSFDYMAPEYALDESLNTASDLYSLGCLIYAVHCKGDPPFKTHGSLGGLRDAAGRPLTGISGLDRDLQSMLNAMITRNPTNRLTSSSLPSHSFFSSLPISTLNFLDRSNFAAKSREEKISFMKGLTSVLDRFSEGLRVRKILPSLLEEMKDSQLLPYILPNVFAISRVLSPTQFAASVLPSLKPLFAIKDPPQNMLTLLNNVKILQEKTEKAVFLEHVMPLIYNALESEHTVVQEQALRVVPDLCESIDYAEVQGVLFPRVALVFTKTKVLTVKVATLSTFLFMVKTLDQTVLTQKLVPLLSKIRTKEPAVMMATLLVQEAMGFKVERESVATAVLPQLWQMAMGPLLNVEQFHKFMSVIKKLGDRVEREHDQFLRDSQRLEDRSAVPVSGAVSNTVGGGVNFENLVGRGDGATVKQDTAINGSSKEWDEDDVWGSIFSSEETVSTPTISPPPVTQTASLPSTPVVSSNATLRPTIPGRNPLGAKPIPSSSLNSSAYNTSSLTTLNSAIPSLSPLQSSNSFSSSKSTSNYSAPNYNPNMAQPLSQSNRSNGTMQPSSIQFGSFSQPMQPTQHTQSTFMAPNYNVSLPQSNPISAFSSPPPQQTPPPFFNAGMGVLSPSKPPQPTWGSMANKPSNNDWGDLDPLG